MQRQKPTESVERFIRKRVLPQADALKAEIAACLGKAKKQIETAYERCDDLEFLKDREADCWLPLFAVCEVLSPERVPDHRECAELLSGQKAEADLDDSLALRLLADIRRLWPPAEANVSTQDLLTALPMQEHSPWADEFKLSDRKLARMLRSFGISSRTVRIGDGTAKGYRRDDFDAAFSVYLPPEG